MSEPIKFRKLPVEVEAMRVPPADDSLAWGSFAAWLFMLGRADGEVSAEQGRIDGVVIRTLEGEMKGEVGDWIIRGVLGEFYPCKPDVFEATYEPVDPCDEASGYHDDGDPMLCTLAEGHPGDHSHHGDFTWTPGTLATDDEVPA